MLTARRWAVRNADLLERVYAAAIPLPWIAGVHRMAHRHQDLVPEIVAESGVLGDRRPSCAGPE